MKKALLFVALSAAFAVACVGLAACSGGGEEDPEKFTVTYYDGDQTTVLKTEEVEAGGKATEWTPEDKADAEFLGWYATPNYAFEFDFDAEITQDTPVYSMWSTAEEDTRTWMIAGNFQGEDLKNNNWGEDGRLNADKYDFEPVEGEFNTFTLTVDLYEGDVFQFGVFRYDEKPGGVYERAWEHQKGFGLLEEPGDNFTDEGNYLASEVNKHDIGVAISGTYEFTMKTDVNNDNIGTITWERLSDAPELEALFTPTIYGTFNGYVMGANIAPEYVMEQTDTAGYEWSLTASMNQGDLMIVLPFNNYNAQVTGGTLTEGSDAVRNPVGYEIMFTETAKYEIQLSITAAGEDEYTYAVTVDNIGAYEAGAKEDKYTVTYRSAEEGTDYTIYLKNGARYPLFTDPVLAENETLMGWHFVGTGANGANEGIPEESTYAADGTVQDGEISYGVTKEGERDTRQFWIKGTGGTANGKPLSWNGGDENVYLEQTGDHEYTATLVLDGAQKEMQVCEDYLGEKTDTYLRNFSIVDYDKLEFIDPESLSNIRFSQNGTYKLTLNSLTMKITVEKIA